ncbi:hypothetical protein D3C80_828680 [compost metagenome]
MFQHQLAGLQFGEVQHVVNDGQQVVGRALDGLQVVGLGDAHFGFQHLAGKAYHAVERSTQLVRHVRQEFGFDARRFLGAFFRQIQLDVLDLHLLQGFAQVGGRLIDVLLHLFMVGRERHRH